MAAPEKSADKNIQLFQKYIADKKILIADAAATSRASLTKTMIGLGARTMNISLASNFEQAKREIESIKPHVVICDYSLGTKCGLDLLQSQRSERPETKDSLFILVTGNTSQSAVAQAAEEDVDCFVLKPFTVDRLRNTILKTAVGKMYPSDYIRTIEEGKRKLFSGEFDEALSEFAKAVSMDPKPALACFYRGQTELMKQALEGAQGSYNEGLEYNSIHYKCLVGLYELLMTRKMHSEAYDIVKRISRYFPTNPERLNAVLRLAIITKSYDDIERYYQSFLAIEARDEGLIRYICAALIVCAKFYLTTGHRQRALTLLQKASTTAGGRSKILREVILVLLDAGQHQAAKESLERFPSETRTGTDFLALEYIVLDKSAPTAQSIDRGRKLVEQGHHDPVIYKVLISRSKSAGYLDSAESYMYDACKRWPERKLEFEASLRGGSN